MKNDEQATEGLAHDLELMKALSSRRQVLQILGGATLLPIVGCGSDEAAPSSDGGVAGSDVGVGGTGGSSGSLEGGVGGTNGGLDGGSSDGGIGGASAGSGGTTAGAAGDDGSNNTDGGVTPCESIPDETGGPFPGDGSNGPNALNVNGVVRSDIRTSFGTLSGTALGVPLTFKLILVNTNAMCAPLAGYAVYAWHCDKDGQYSLYTVANQNYLRGVQATDASGIATFLSIFPGCYSGRWPHVHFEIFQDVAGAMTASGKIKTSQFALPTDVCNAVFATSGYEQSITNFANTSLAMDSVFNDGVELQMVSVTGNPTDGYVATLVVGVAA